MSRSHKLVIAGLVVLFLIAVGADPMLMKLTADFTIVAIFVGIGVLLIRPKLGWQIILSNLALLFFVGLFGPAIDGWLRLAFGGTP